MTVCQPDYMFTKCYLTLRQQTLEYNWGMTLVFKEGQQSVLNRFYVYPSLQSVKHLSVICSFVLPHQLCFNDSKRFPTLIAREIKSGKDVFLV